MIYFLIYISLITEVWKIIPRFGGSYSASSFGNIRNNTRVAKNKYMSQVSHKDYEYMHVRIRMNHKRSTYRVHRLVMEAFEGESGLDVNHIIGDKRNNNIYNLEYCSKKDNIQHAIQNNFIKRGKECSRSMAVIQIFDNGSEIIHHGSREAQRATGINSGSICRACKKGCMAGGYKWKWQIAA